MHNVRFAAPLMLAVALSTTCFGQIEPTPVKSKTQQQGKVPAVRQPPPPQPPAPIVTVKVHEQAGGDFKVVAEIPRFQRQTWTRTVKVQVPRTVTEEYVVTVQENGKPVQQSRTRTKTVMVMEPAEQTYGTYKPTAKVTVYLADPGPCLRLGAKFGWSPVDLKTLKANEKVVLVDTYADAVKYNEQIFKAQQAIARLTGKVPDVAAYVLVKKAEVPQVKNADSLKTRGGK